MASPVVSVVMPVRNGENFLVATFDGLLSQTYRDFEICVYNDGSTDRTSEILEHYSKRFSSANIRFRYSSGPISKGVGYAKNRAVQQSIGRFLCFNDADDISLPRRIDLQVNTCLSAADPDNCFVGSNFARLPANSTENYTRWACTLSDEQLHKQIYTAFGPTLIAPTWFLSRKLYDQVGGFREDVPTGYPEDLDFFYRSLAFNPTLIKVPKSIVLYRHHTNCATHSVIEQTIWDLRIAQLQRDVLDELECFSIWDIGKWGRKFFRSLSMNNREKVVAFCSIHNSKVRQRFCEVFDDENKRCIARVPAISHRDVQPPVVITAKFNMMDGAFDELLSTSRKDWSEGRDYFLFN